MSTLGKEYKLAIRIAGIIDKTFNTSLSSADKSIKGLARQIDSTFTKMDKYGDKAFHAMTRAAQVAAAAIGTVSVAAIKVGSDFEKEMSAVQAISSASASELEQLKEKARELGESTVFSATEVGQAMEYMGLAGWKTEQMLNGIEGVLNLAAASGEDLALISDIVTDDLTAFNMTAEETTRMVDVMAATAMNSNTTVEMMGEAMKYAGTAAGTMGYRIEDVSIAIGAIASQGIKASMAGTALRNMITRIVKPTKESSEAMDALGISLYNDSGELNSFLDILKQVREGMKQYSVDRQNYYAAELGGQRGMAAIAAIANLDQEAFNQLTNAIYNSKGAADQMASVRLDNLQGDITILRDAVTDLGIEAYENASGGLRELVQAATKVVSTFKDKMPEIGRKVGKTVVPVFEKLVGIEQWTIDHGDGIISVLTGIATSIMAFKAMSTVSHAVTGIMSIFSMGPAAPWILGITAAAGAIAALVVHIKQARAEAKDNSLAEHFGNLALSMSEVREVAEALVKDKSFLKAQFVLDEFEKLDNMASSLEDNASTLRKLNWRVEFGIDLEEKDNEKYRETIANYIEEAKDFMTQAQYSSNLNLSDYADPNGSIMQKVNQFFDISRGQLEDKAVELSDVVTAAFEDDFLSIDEEREIARLQQQMQNIIDKVSTSEFNASMALTRAKYGSMADLDAESFAAMQEEINENMAAYEDAQEQKYIKAYSAAEMAGATQEELADITLQHLNNIAAKNAEMTDLMTNTIADAYGLQDILTEVDDALLNAVNNGDLNFSATDESRAEAIIQGLEKGLSGADIDAIRELLDQLAPQEEQLEALAEQYREAGEGIPSNILEGIKRYKEMELMVGDTEDLWEYLGTILADSGEYTELLKQLESDGSEIPESLRQAVEDSKNAVDPAAAALYDELQRALTEKFSEELAVNATVRVNIASAAAKLAYAREERIANHYSGGIVTSPELSWLAEKGPEAVVPLDGSKNALSLWAKAGQLLGMGSVLDNYDLSPTSSTSIEYKPTLQFYGNAPSKNDMVDAMRISQDEFDSLMRQYLKNGGRVAFG